MMKPVYILSSCAISPQHSFDAEQFLQPPVSSQDGMLFVTDPDYREFINPVAIRRMSRQLKMGISAGMCALQRADVRCPDAIITGTGLGSMTDMEHFLKDMIRMNEEALNPTYFIQSTYNSVNGWLALQSQSTGYNQTYVHRGLSLELSLLDAQLLLAESDSRQVVLAGCFDELTPDYFVVKGKIGYWKKEAPCSADLLMHDDTDGTIAGEGAAFFTLTNRPEGTICTLQGIKMMEHTTPADVQTGLERFLSDSGILPGQIDLVLTGKNGDARTVPLYDAVLASITERTTVAAFKHLTGEYPTASGFALWLATQMYTSGSVPGLAVLKKGTADALKHILIVNHYITGSVSLMLLRSA